MKQVVDIDDYKIVFCNKHNKENVLNLKVYFGNIYFQDVESYNVKKGVINQDINRNQKKAVDSIYNFHVVVEIVIFLQNEVVLINKEIIVIILIMFL